MVIIIMGVSGCGKTTVGKALAAARNAQFVDADAFHSPENLSKMQQGTALNETDRVPWLQALRSAIDGWVKAEQNVVLACSALTVKSRELLGIEGIYNKKQMELVFLKGDSELIAQRMSQRDHFMPVALLDSQFSLLEAPINALTLDITLAPEELVAKIISSIK